MKRNNIKTKCAECGEIICGGEDCYRILGKVLCVTCVKYARVVFCGDSERLDDAYEDYFNNNIYGKTATGGCSDEKR